MKKLFFLSPSYCIVFFLSWFGLGATPIPIAPFFNLPLILVLVRTKPLGVNLIPLFLTIALGAGLAYHEPTSPFGNYFDDLKVLVMVGCVISAFTLFPMVTHRFILNYTDIKEPIGSNSWYHSWLIFPLLWTATWSLIRRYSPLGSWGDWAYTIYNWGYTDYMIYNHRIKRFNFQQNDTEETPLLDNRSSNDRIKKVLEYNWYLMFAFGILFLALFVGGSYRLQQIEDNNEPLKTMPIGCVLPTRDVSIDDLLKSSDTLATNHNSKIVLWSESAISIRNQKEFNDMMDKAKNKTKEKHFFLGLTYTIGDDVNMHKKKNMLTLMGPDGKVIFNYQKVNPVPLVESYYIEGGQNDPPVENITTPKTKLDRDPVSIEVSGAICLDMDFPELLGKAAKAYLVLSPARTWSAHIGLHHLRMASVRAIENGYWILRCDGGGASGLIDPLGRVRHVEISPNTKNMQLFSWDIPVEEPKIKTIYAEWGEWSIWGTLAFLGVLRLGWIAAWEASPYQMGRTWDDGVRKFKNGRKWIEYKYNEMFENERMNLLV
ncbi:9533_t:CDS:2 [Dentiscutata erythropus]|uniref:9533_t:CDS:1 n=1 Tax=Dentiscutata erythropus TaxID=1348616 RepID=A0A9N9AX41_9GLOM|nr:9533_t:CDS:2 [Dentiscutata erythropus]